MFQTGTKNFLVLLVIFIVLPGVIVIYGTVTLTNAFGKEFEQNTLDRLPKNKHLHTFVMFSKHL